MFIVSLAIADLIVGLVVMPMSTVYIFTEDWMFGVGLCQLWIAVDYTASTASILNLFILSLDRYWSVTSPLKYLSKRTTKRALIMISLVLNLIIFIFSILRYTAAAIDYFISQLVVDIVFQKKLHTLIFGK